MINLGFSQQEINWANAIYNVEGRWVPKIAQQIMGNAFNDYTAQNLVKEYIKLLQDDNLKDSIQNLTSSTIFDDMPNEDIYNLTKHYQKMVRKFNRGGKWFMIDDFYRLGIQDRINTFAVCRNLNAPYDIYNQGRYVDGSDKYKLVKKTNKYGIIETKRHPFAQRESDLESDQASIERKEFSEEEIYEVKIKAEHLGTLNRFAVFIALKPPVTHCGCFVIINGAGNAIYIYALEFNNDLKFENKLANRGGQWGGKTYILGYGFDNNVLKSTLLKATEYIKKYVDPRVVILVRPEHQFEEGINWFVDLPEDNEVNFDF